MYVPASERRAMVLAHEPSPNPLGLLPDGLGDHFSAMADGTPQQKEAYEKVCLAQTYLKGKPRLALTAGEEAMKFCGEHAKGLEPAALCVVVQAHLSITDISQSWQVKEAGIAAKKAKEGLAKFKKAGDDAGASLAISAMVYALLANGRTAKAIRTAQDACTLFRSLGDKSKETMMLQLVAQQQLKREQPEAAFKAAETVKTISASVADKAAALQTMYEVQISKSDFAGALETAMELKKLFVSNGDRKQEALAMLQIVNVQYMQAEFADAVSTAREAQAMLHDVGAAKEEAKALHVIAQAHLSNEEPDLAMQAISRARKLHQDSGHDDGMAHTLLLYVQVTFLTMLEGGDDIRGSSGLAEVLDTALEAVALCKKIKNTGLAATALCWIAQIQALSQNIEGAFNSVGEAMWIYRQGGQQCNMAKVMCIEADLRLMSGQPETAMALANRALKIFQAHKDTWGEAVAAAVVGHATGISVGGDEEEYEEEWGEEGEGEWTEEEWALWEAQQAEGGGGGETAIVKPKKKKVVLGDKLDMTNTSQDAVASRLQEIVKSIVDVDDDDEVDLDTPLMQVGVTSKSAVELRNALTEEMPGINMPFTLVFDYPTVNAMAELVMEQNGPTKAIRR
mmetsp:Transcript_37090/g.104642  ORF Transcript_37090/g.104642 Transcript_37090/m.104642 type:complete len:624 (+) Transcript_37090:3-1874(+)